MSAFKNLKHYERYLVITVGSAIVFETAILIGGHSSYPTSSRNVFNLILKDRIKRRIYVNSYDFYNA